MMHVSYSAPEIPKAHLVQAIKEKLEAHRNEADSKAMAAYMKHHFSFLGIKKDQRHALILQWLKDASKMEFHELQQVVLGLWQLEEREFQYVALDFLLKHKKVSGMDEIAFLESLIISKSWWDTVDLLATHRVGVYFQKYPLMIPIKLNEWNASSNRWLIRTGILFQLKYKAATDQDLLFALCEMHGHQKEFFIAKAIGWALREWAKHQPEAVKHFVSNTPLQPLSKREALKHFK